MENNVLRKVKNLIDDFVDEKENGLCEMVYEKFYAYLAYSFSEAVNELCKTIIFGHEYSLSPREIYDYDRYIAVEAWNDHVDHQFGDFPDWVSEVFRDDIKDFTSEFQKWLASQDDEQASDVIVALMTGGIDLTEIITDWWLYDRLRGEDWDYPA